MESSGDLCSWQDSESLPHLFVEAYCHVGSKSAAATTLASPISSVMAMTLGPQELAWLASYKARPPSAGNNKKDRKGMRLHVHGPVYILRRHENNSSRSWGRVIWWAQKRTERSQCRSASTGSRALFELW